MKQPYDKGQFKNLFVLEPNQELNEAYQVAFASHGIQVSGYFDYGELNKALEEVVPDAVIVDLRLPSEAGVESFKLFRKAHPQLPTYLTATFDIEPRLALELGVLGIFYKPFRVKQVVTQLLLDFKFANGK
ncbi:MAG: response regulator transcription factor [Bdellovibrionales bacterium]|nr:response regulator transcription factor [Bdellovibrionales bacterium]